MLRTSIFAATVCALGCQSSKPPVSPRPATVDDSALRIRVARAEARRAGGVAELVELATGNDVHARELALRGLGRIGGEKAIETIEAAFADRDPRVVAAAFAAMGLRGALDDKLDWDGRAAVQAIVAGDDVTVRMAAAEALGRAATAGAQSQLVACVSDPQLAASCALALGRLGRRKIAFVPAAAPALIGATLSVDAAVRYAATYALAREHEPAADSAVAAALVTRIADEVPEIRATAIAGLAKRKALDVGRRGVEASLGDADWRVAVEAARALAGADEPGRALVATSLARRWSELVEGDAADAHVIIASLRALAGKPLTARTALDAVTALGERAGADTTLPAITRGWIQCLARVVAPPAAAGQIVEAIASCSLPDHLKLPLLVTDGLGDAAVRRAALRVLLAHDDPRVRAAGLGAFAATWKDADARGQQTLVSTLTAAIASKNPIVASAGIDAADAIYDAAGTDSPHRVTLDAAIAARARAESDVELSTQLYTTIGKRSVAGGADACRAGLSGHPVRAKAAVECLRQLGEAVDMPAPAPAAPPPHDVAGVIGHHVTWRLETTRGTLEIELRPDVAPWAVATIAALTQRGYYNGLELHRVVPNFVAQGGDPTQSGYGGPGFVLPAEPSSTLDGAGYVAGGVGMADAGPDSAGSQWFVMHGRAPHLDGRYTWVGSVIEGQKSADALQIGDRVERAEVVIK